MTATNIVTGGGNGSPPETTSGSLLDNLRKAAAKQAEEKQEDFAVGGDFGKQLWIRYAPIDEGPMDRFISRRAALRENPDLPIPITGLNMDLMAQACICVLGADENGQNKQVLKDEQGVVKLEHRLIELLGMVPPDTAGKLDSHEAIMLLFGGNAMAVVSHGDELTDWLNDPKSRVDPQQSSGTSG